MNDYESSQSYQLIKEMTQMQATSGHEYAMRAFMADKMRPYVDFLEQDGLGGIFGVRQNTDETAPRVMFASHMDEVGFMVAQITDNGLFKVLPLGGWSPHVVSAQRFTLQTKENNYPCISSSIPPHLLRGKQSASELSVEDILFDAGFKSYDEAVAYGVAPGDTIVPQTETILTANKERVIAKAWDNRYGCSAIIESLQSLKDETLPNTLIAGANVQEEVGLRGAKGSTTKFKPDVFFAVDCSPANDTQTKNGTFGHLDEGILLRIQDPGFILLRGMKEFLLDTAQTHNIPFQYFVSKGGTDAGAAHVSNEGVPSAVIGVCARYIHTHQSMFSIKDYEAAKEMIMQIAKTLDKTTLETIRSRN